MCLEGGRGRGVRLYKYVGEKEQRITNRFVVVPKIPDGTVRTRLLSISFYLRLGSRPVVAAPLEIDGQPHERPAHL